MFKGGGQLSESGPNESIVNLLRINASVLFNKFCIKVINKITERSKLDL
jgi:hypothetical protein